MLLHDGIDEYLMELEQNRELEQDAGRTDTIQEGIHAQTYVFEKGADYWKLMREWNNANRKLTAKEVGILDAACAIPHRIPSEKQSHILISAENRAKIEGFFPG